MSLGEKGENQSVGPADRILCILPCDKVTRQNLAAAGRKSLIIVKSLRCVFRAALVTRSISSIMEIASVTDKQQDTTRFSEYGERR